MPSTCTDIRLALAQCLQGSDCVLIHRNTPAACLRAPLNATLPTTCQQLKRGYGDCKRGQIDMRKRFRGNRGWATAAAAAGPQAPQAPQAGAAAAATAAAAGASGASSPPDDDDAPPPPRRMLYAGAGTYEEVDAEARRRERAKFQEGGEYERYERNDGGEGWRKR